MKNLRFLCTLFALTASLSACGISGDKGVAIFHVGENWTKDVPIASGSTFAVTAEKNDLFHAALLTSSGLPSVARMPDGSFQAVQAGPAQFQAQDPSTKSVVDTVEFTVADPVAISLGAWWANTGNNNQILKLPKKFALVQNGRYVGGIVLEDATGTRLNHAAIAAMECPNVQFKVVGEFVEATATTLGDTQATVHLLGKNAGVTASYNVMVRSASDVADLHLTSLLVQNGASAPADPEKAPVNSDSGASATTTKSQVYVLSTAATLADGTPIYGATLQWNEVDKNGQPTTGHLLTKQSNGGNYAVLKSGETVKVTVTIGALSQQVTLTAP